MYSDLLLDCSTYCKHFCKTLLFCWDWFPIITQVEEHLLISDNHVWWFEIKLYMQVLFLYASPINDLYKEINETWKRYTDNLQCLEWQNEKSCTIFNRTIHQNCLLVICCTLYYYSSNASFSLPTLIVFIALECVGSIISQKVGMISK
jgi:hypothetical protein